MHKASCQAFCQFFNEVKLCIVGDKYFFLSSQFLFIVLELSGQITERRQHLRIDFLFIFVVPCIQSSMSNLFHSTLYVLYSFILFLSLFLYCFDATLKQFPVIHNTFPYFMDDRYNLTILCRKSFFIFFIILIIVMMMICHSYTLKDNNHGMNFRWF